MKKQKALFLDRDGVINIDHGYVSKIEDFEFTKGIFELLHLFIKKGYLLFIITNQSGIGRGYYTVNDFETLTEWMLKCFKDKEITIQKVAYCQHAPEDNCLCRKPQTGMIDDILKHYPIDLSTSWLIGDKQSDIDLSRNANIQHSIAIGAHEIANASYQFTTISDCHTFLKKEQDRLL
jgi:D-glycero-D-manno-heptose 1,7-bisphosphate phosphatase